MKRYIAFLRGVNISGRNKVTMTELKKGIERLGYEEVKTYLNSGNVIFSSDENDIGSITKQIVMTIKSQFDLDIPVFVIAKEELEDILHNAPDWWGNDDKEIYDNLIFIMPPVIFTDVFNEIGEPKEELEKIQDYKEVIFWSFSRKNYQKTNWWSKTVSAGISNKDIVKYFYEVIVSENMIDELSKYISEDCVQRTGEKEIFIGINGMKQHLVALKKTYPDYTMKIIRQYVTDDYVISEFIMRGTHKGEFIGITPTNKVLEITGVDIDKVIDGKIVEHGGAANTFETFFEHHLIKPI